MTADKPKSDNSLFWYGVWFRLIQFSAALPFMLFGFLSLLRLFLYWLGFAGAPHLLSFGEVFLQRK